MNCTDCILDGTDACSRGAGRAIDDKPCKDFFNTKTYDGFKLSGACTYTDCNECEYYAECDEWIE